MQAVILIGDNIENGTWIILCGAVVSTIAGMVAALFSWLSARDKLRYDAEMIKHRQLVAQHESKIVTLQTENEKCMNKSNHQDSQISQLEGQRLSDARELGELRGIVTYLQQSQVPHVLIKPQQRVSKVPPVKTPPSDPTTTNDTPTPDKDA